MSLISRMRKQKAVWFQKLGQNRFDEASFAAGVLIDCRWDDKQEEFVDPEGKRQLSAAIAYVDRVISPGDLLLLSSTLPAWNGSDNPKHKDGVRRAAVVGAIPNLRSTETLRPVHLV